MKKKGESAQIDTVRNEKREVTTDTTAMKRIIREYFNQLCAIKWTT